MAEVPGCLETISSSWHFHPESSSGEKNMKENSCCSLVLILSTRCPPCGKMYRACDCQIPLVIACPGVRIPNPGSRSGITTLIIVLMV